MCDRFAKFLVTTPPIVLVQAVLLVFPIGLFGIGGYMKTHTVMDYHASKVWTDVFGKISSTSLCVSPSAMGQTSSFSIDEVLDVNETCSVPQTPVPPSTKGPVKMARRGKRAAPTPLANSNVSTTLSRQTTAPMTTAPVTTAPITTVPMTTPPMITSSAANRTGEENGSESVCVQATMNWLVTSKQACQWAKLQAGVSLRGLVCASQLDMDVSSGYLNITADVPKRDLNDCCKKSTDDCELGVMVSLTGPLQGLLPDHKPMPQFCKTAKMPPATQWLSTVRTHGNKKCNSKTAALRTKYHFYTHQLLFSLMLSEEDRVAVTRATNGLAAFSLTFAFVVMVTLVCNTQPKRVISISK